MVTWLYVTWLYVTWLYVTWLYVTWLYVTWLYVTWLYVTWLYVTCPRAPHGRTLRDAFGKKKEESILGAYKKTETQLRVGSRRDGKPLPGWVALPAKARLGLQLLQHRPVVAPKGGDHLARRQALQETLCRAPRD